MAAFGFLFHGTISHFFYNALDAALPGTAAITVIQKASAPWELVLCAGRLLFILLQ